jgi:hypothetical protein
VIQAHKDRIDEMMKSPIKRKNSSKTRNESSDVQTRGKNAGNEEYEKLMDNAS